MRQRTEWAAFAAVIGVSILLVGCEAESTGPPVEGPESTEARTYAYPDESDETAAAKRTVEEEPGCRPARSAEKKATSPLFSYNANAPETQTDVRVTPIFEGTPNVDDITLSEHLGKKWLNEWSAPVESTKLLMSVVQKPDGDYRELGAEDLDKVMLRHADAPDDVQGLACDDPIPITSRFIGVRPADPDSHPTAIWEISSDQDITSDPELLFTAWIDGEELSQLGTVHVMDEGNDIVASLGNSFKARADLDYYYANR